MAKTQRHAPRPDEHPVAGATAPPRTTLPPWAPVPASDTERVLDLARWAPSGDNAQTWRFEPTGPRSARIHAWDTREHCVYDLQGRGSQLAFGMLLETLVIAATRYGLRADVRRDTASPDPRPVFAVTLVPDPHVKPSPLAEFIPVRATQRRAMWTRPLTPSQKAAMEAAAGPGVEVLWLETPAERLRVARLLALSAKLRLRLRETYDTHRRVIQWHARQSEDRMPDTSLGLSAASLAVTRWAMADWRRVRLVNTMPGGTLAPRLELDVLPGLACAAHAVLVAREPPQDFDAHVGAGRAWQRLWLEATRQGLWMQPEMTPLIFAGYARDGVEFTQDHRSAPFAGRVAKRLAKRLEGILGARTAQRAFALTRIGSGPAPASRSLRLPLDRLQTLPTG